MNHVHSGMAFKTGHTAFSMTEISSSKPGAEVSLGSTTLAGTSTKNGRSAASLSGIGAEV